MAKSETLTPYPYQIEGARFLEAKRRAILADAPGVGKTVQALYAAAYIGARDNLIVCPTLAEMNWAYEVGKWFPLYADRVAVFSGTPLQRQKALMKWSGMSCNEGPRFLITHYQAVDQLPERPWQCVIMDEAHRLRTRGALFEKAQRLRSYALFLLTGTPIVKKMIDILPLIQLLEPQKFRSYWKLVDTFFASCRGPYGEYVIGGAKNIAEFRQFVYQYMLRRTKEQTMPWLPKKVRRPLLLNMLPEQARIYNELADDFIAMLPDKKLILTPNVVAQLTKLREILISPQLVGADAPGSTIEAVTEWAEAQHDIGRPVVIFTPFTKAVPLIERALLPVGMKSTHIVGGMSAKQIGKAAQSFQAGTYDAIVCSIKMAESYNLHASSQALFVGADWNPTENEQAEDRLHRNGQDEPVNVDYAMHQGTVDEHVFAVNDRKLADINAVLTPYQIVRGGK